MGHLSYSEGGKGFWGGTPAVCGHPSYLLIRGCFSDLSTRLQLFSHLSWLSNQSTKSVEQTKAVGPCLRIRIRLLLP